MVLIRCFFLERVLEVPLCCAGLHAGILHRTTVPNTRWWMTELSALVLSSLCGCSHQQVKIKLLAYNRPGNKAQVSDSLIAS